MGLTRNVPYRIASFVHPAKMRTSFSYVTAVTRAIIHIALSRKWSTYRKAIGEFIFLFFWGSWGVPQLYESKMSHRKRCKAVDVSCHKPNS